MAALPVQTLRMPRHGAVLEPEQHAVSRGHQRGRAALTFDSVLAEEPIRAIACRLVHAPQSA